MTWSWRTPRKAGDVGALVYDLQHYPVTTASMIKGTSVLDEAAPIPPSRKHLAAIFGAAGFFASLAIGSRRRHHRRRDLEPAAAS